MQGNPGVITLLNELLAVELTAVHFLDGRPDVSRVGTITPGGTVEEQFRADLAIETGAVGALNRGIAQYRAAGDNGTAELLEDILEDTEEHAHWLESQLFVVGQIGLAQHLAEQIKKPAS